MTPFSQNKTATPTNSSIQKVVRRNRVKLRKSTCFVMFNIFRCHLCHTFSKIENTRISGILGIDSAEFLEDTVPMVEKLLCRRKQSPCLNKSIDFLDLVLLINSRYSSYDDKPIYLFEIWISSTSVLLNNFYKTETKSAVDVIYCENQVKSVFHCSKQ